MFKEVRCTASFPPILPLLTSLVLQVGKLRDEKKILQADIAELMAVRFTFPHSHSTLH